MEPNEFKTLKHLVVNLRQSSGEELERHVRQVVDTFRDEVRGLRERLDAVQRQVEAADREKVEAQKVHTKEICFW